MKKAQKFTDLRSILGVVFSLIQEDENRGESFPQIMTPHSSKLNNNAPKNLD